MNKKRFPKKRFRNNRPKPFNIPTKTSDVAFGSFAPTSSSSILIINGNISQGTNFDSRQGSHTVMTSVNMRATITDAGATIPSFYRIMLIYDKFPNQALPSPATIFSGTGLGVNTFIDPELVSRFQVLYNSYAFHINLIATGAYPSQGNWSLYRKFKLPTRWVGTGSGIGNISEGALMLVVTSDNVLSVNSHDFNISTRVNFVDSQIGNSNFRGKNNVSKNWN